MRNVLSFTQANSYGTPKEVLRHGLKYLSFYLTIMVSPYFQVKRSCSDVCAVVMTKVREKDGATKYHVIKRVCHDLCYIFRIKQESLAHSTGSTCPVQFS